MRIYWSYSSIPELSGLDKRERRRRWRRCCRQAFRHWQMWMLMLAQSGIIFGLAWASDWLHTSLSSVWLWRVGNLFILIAGVSVVVFLSGQVTIYYVRPYLQRERPEACSRCGYDLRGSIAAGQTSCPECGEVLDAEQMKMAQPQSEEAS